MQPGEQSSLLHCTASLASAQEESYLPLSKPSDAILGLDLAEYCLLQSQFANSVVLVCKALTHPWLVSAQVFVILKCLLDNVGLIAVTLVQGVYIAPGHEHLGRVYRLSLH